LLKHKESTLCR